MKRYSEGRRVKGCAVAAAARPLSPSLAEIICDGVSSALGSAPVFFVLSRCREPACVVQNHALLGAMSGIVKRFTALARLQGDTYAVVPRPEENHVLDHLLDDISGFNRCAIPPVAHLGKKRLLQ